LKLGSYSFGVTSAIITSMGLIAGLNYGAHTKATIVGGLLIIALVDNVSDAFGIHVYKESETSDRKEIFATTIGNFLVRFVVTLSFILLTIILPTSMIVWAASVWGLLLLALLSVNISRAKGSHTAMEIVKHLSLAGAVIIASKYIGLFITTRLR
jgi:vacuolar iron transporter family protein